MRSFVRCATKCGTKVWHHQFTPPLLDFQLRGLETSIHHFGFSGNIYFCNLYTLPSPHTKFQAQRTSFDKSCIINEMTVNIIVFIHIWYLHTITYTHTKFQPQRTLFDKSWIINEMTVTNIFSFHIWYLHTLPFAHAKFQPILMTLSFGLFFGTPLEE